MINEIYSFSFNYLVLHFVYGQCTLACVQIGIVNVFVFLIPMAALVVVIRLILGGYLVWGEPSKSDFPFSLPLG